MVKDRGRWKNRRQERVVPTDGEADALRRLRMSRVRDNEFRRVTSLTTNQRAADVPGARI